MKARTVAITTATVVAIGLAASLALKEPCTLGDWADDFPYRNYCYSDILPLYYRFHLHEEPPRLPYLVPLEELHGVPIEYPPVTVAFAWGVALVTDGLVAYMHVTHLLLLGAGGIVAWMLWRGGADWKRVAFWGAGPAVIVHGLTNWDLLAVALAAGGWLAWTRDRPFAAAVLFGLGGAAKVYPAFFLPYLALACLLRRRPGATEARSLRERDWKGVVDVTLGGLAGLVAPNLLIWRLAPEAWLDVWRFHAEREPDWETPYEVVRELLGGADTAGWHDLVSRGGLAILIVVGLLLAAAMWRRRLDPLVAGALATLAFLLVNRVYSPQYTLWALPLLLALRVPWPPVLAFAAADLAVFLLRYPLFYGDHPPDDPLRLWHGIAVLARWAALLWATAWLVWREGLLSRGRPRPTPTQGPTAPVPALTPSGQPKDP